MSYTALHERYGLPSPPSKNLFSTSSSESSRAWLPDFANEAMPVQAMLDFVQDLFYASQPKNTFIQLKVLSAFLGVIIVSAILIISRRLYDRSFWLFRFVVRTNGTLIIPNAITIFSVLEGAFVAVLIALDWVYIGWFELKKDNSSIMLWISLPWCPLFVGAYCSALGVLYAQPNALLSVSPQPRKDPGWALRMGITPTVVNIIFGFIPIIQLISILIPAILAHNRFSSALNLYKTLLRESAGVNELNRDMLLQAQVIWYMVLNSAYYLCICMVVWASWAFLLFFAYLGCGGSLALVLRSQVKTLKGIKNNQSFSESFAAQQLKREEALAIGQFRIGSKNNEPIAEASPRPQTGKKATGKFGASHASGQSQSSSDEQVESMFFTREELENKDQPVSSFFPVVKPSAFARPLKHTAKGKKDSQRRYLQKFYANFLVQLTGIMGAIVLFICVAIKLVLTCYSSWEANDFGQTLQFAVLFTTYSTVVAGSLIFFAILGRTYEPVLSSFQNSSTPRTPGLTFIKASALSWATGAISHLFSDSKDKDHIDKRSSLVRKQRGNSGSGLDALPMQSLYAELMNESRELKRGASVNGSLTARDFFDESRGDKLLSEKRRPSQRTLSTVAESTVDGVMIDTTVTRSYKDHSHVKRMDLESGGQVLSSNSSTSSVDQYGQGLSTTSPTSFGYGHTFGSQTPATPASTFSPYTPYSANPLLGDQNEGGFPSPLTSSPGGPFSLRRSTSSHRNSRQVMSPVSRPPAAWLGSFETGSLIGLGIGGEAPTWTAPTVWDSGEPDPELVRQEREMRTRARRTRSSSSQGGT